MGVYYEKSFGNLNEMTYIVRLQLDQEDVISLAT